ncbi:MAG: vitamin B12-dependent ribonucleotide reductase [Dehalococcoidia bacterium]
MEELINQIIRLGPNHIAQAVAAAAEARGTADRPFPNELANQIIQRLDTAPPMPGFEDLVTPPRKGPGKSLPANFTLKEVLGQIQALAPEAPAPEAPAPEAPAPEAPAMEPPAVEAPGLDVDQTPEAATASSTPLLLTDNARQVLERRYLKKGSHGEPAETPEELLRRVAANIASAELAYGPEADVGTREAEFYQVMVQGEFLPNSPTLMNAGRELQQLSACFVLPIEDTMESIFDAVKYTALIHKSGGGTGFSFTRLRPASDIVGSTGGVASGPVSFMRAFDTATEVIKQGGMRRGANMGILLVHHPDIMTFIEAKKDPEVLTNFNISVAVTDRFMEAVENDTDYDLINPRSQEVAGQLRARDVFDKIVDMAWKTGDPGIVFLDRINRANPTPHLGDIESTNPCGEQPLLPYESCNLGSINLSLMVLHSVKGGPPGVDYERLGRVVTTAVRFLDNVIDMNKFPIDQIAVMTRKNRKIGLGIMGFADMLIEMGIAYDSEEGLSVAEEVMGFIDRRATEVSVELGKERGVFPAFKGSIYDRGRKGQRVRNATRTTIAPTGTLSIIAGCSGGIEPLFALSFVRTILDNEQFVEVNPYFEETARDRGFYSPELMRRLAQGECLRDIENVPEDIKKRFVTAHDISPEWHVRMQAAFQKHTDNAVSKTVNFPHDATREDVAGVYMLANQEGLKGITIYRDRSKERQVLSTGSAPGETAEEVQEAAAVRGIVPRSRPKSTRGFTEKVTTGCGTVYVTVNSDEQGICEVFTSLGKAGGCASAQLEATSRLISLALRSGVDTASVMKNLRGIRCPSIAWEDGHAVLSCADAIASVLENYLGEERQETSGLDISVNRPENSPGTKTVATAPADQGMGPSQVGQCPDCGSSLVYQEGCHHCPGCGYTKC